MGIFRQMLRKIEPSYTGIFRHSTRITFFGTPFEVINANNREGFGDYRTMYSSYRECVLEAMQAYYWSDLYGKQNPSWQLQEATDKIWWHKKSRTHYRKIW